MSDGSYAKVNGLNMYYEIHGVGPPLVLLHGGTLSIEWFKTAVRAALPFFASAFRVIAPEQLGHGRTGDAMDREFHFHDMAEDTVELMRQLSIESAFVVGVSNGGTIGLDMAIHHPERVTKLVVIGSNFRIDGWEEGFKKFALTTKPEDWPQHLREAYERLSPDGPGHWPVVLDRLQRMWAVEPNYTREQLASIKAPTLVIIGDRDAPKPEHAVEMFREIAGAQLCVIPHAGHGVLPKETILTFLSEPVTSAH